MVNSSEKLNDTTPPTIELKQQDSPDKISIAAVLKIAKTAEQSQSQLIDIATSAHAENIRCRAIQYISHLPTLLKLQGANTPIANAAAHQYQRILAGCYASELNKAERLAAITGLTANQQFEIALISSCKDSIDLVLSGIDTAAQLKQLCLNASSVEMRKKALLKINDVDCLNAIRSEMSRQHKSVNKVLDQKLAAFANDSSIETSKPISSPEKEKEPDKQVQENQDKEKNEDNIPDNLTQVKTDLDKLSSELDVLSHKNTAPLYSLSSANTTLTKRIANIDNAEGLLAELDSLKDKLKGKIDSNSLYQNDLLEKTISLKKALETAIEEGKSQDALRLWDKILGSLKNTNGKVHKQIEQSTSEFKSKIDELRNWKIFASTEKKKELIAQIEHLEESKMHAADKARHIRKLHEQWKLLGKSHHNETLWTQFKTLSDLAYKPCKEYFKERKKAMANNLKQRREICTQLESFLEQLDLEQLQLSSLNKIEKQAQQEWKDHAPVEQNKIKLIQKRYHDILNKFRKIRKNITKQHSGMKLDLIKKAQELSESDDNKMAMDEAKKLQQQWKEIGPSNYKDDNQYWKDFRAACDKIFQKRDSQKNKTREDKQKLQLQLNTIVSSLEKFMLLDDETLRSSRDAYKDIQQSFSALLSPKSKYEHTRLLENHNELSRKIEHRFSALPSKKQLDLKRILDIKIAFCQRVETRLLACQTTDEFSVAVQEFQAGFEGMEESSSPSHNKLLAARLTQDLACSSQESLKLLSEQQSELARVLSVEMEIRASIDSPVSDQSLRMKMQLDQLKQGFGQQKPSSEANRKYAQEVALRVHCLGPIDTELHQELNNRVARAAKKLG